MASEASLAEVLWRPLSNRLPEASEDTMKRFRGKVAVITLGIFHSEQSVRSPRSRSVERRSRLTQIR